MTFTLLLVRNVKAQSGEEDGSDSEDLDDEEVSLGSMDEEDFGLELEEEGGAFVNPDEDEGRSVLGSLSTWIPKI